MQLSETGSSRDDHDHDHDHEHGHGHGAGGSSRTLGLVAAINVVGFLTELAGGLLFNSVALLSDAVHMLFDALAYVMAFVAAYIAANYAVSDRWSYGLHRLEPLSAFLNGALLIPMVALILYASYQRILDPIAIDTVPTLVIAVGGLVVNIVSVYVLEGDAMSLNERGAFYHLLGDAGASIAVIVSVVVVEITGIRAIDPITAVLIAVLITWSAGKLLWGSGAIFLHRTPFDGDEIRATLSHAEGIDEVNDLHAWQICSEITIATAHVEASVETMDEAETVTHRVHDVLAEYGVDHATVELCPTPRERRTHLAAHSH